jgi:hypothetical protein
MDIARTNEIACLFLKHKMRKEGLSALENRKEVVNAAKEIGINSEEALEFADKMFREVLWARRAAKTA